MPRWICSLLVVLVAFGGLIQHGEMAVSADVPVHHMWDMSIEKIAGDTPNHGKPYQAPEADMTDACAIVCLGTATLWNAAMQSAPIMSEHSLEWPFTDALHEGRGVGPGLRPPKFI